MNFIFLGPPGAGKGTLAAKIAEEYTIPHISTGDIFRKAIKDQTPLGKKVKDIIDSGALVSDDITCALVEERIKQSDCQNGFILDGFPRTIPQAEAFEKICNDCNVVNLVVDNQLIIDRLSNRRVCKGCGKTYNIKYLLPKTEGKCDDCGDDLYTRDDDKIESITHRLEVYEDQTAPLISFYKALNKITDIDGTKELEEKIESFKKAFPHS